MIKHVKSKNIDVKRFVHALILCGSDFYTKVAGPDVASRFFGNVLQSPEKNFAGCLRAAYKKSNDASIHPELYRRSLWVLNHYWGNLDGWVDFDREGWRSHGWAWNKDKQALISVKAPEKVKPGKKPKVTMRKRKPLDPKKLPPSVRQKEKKPKASKKPKSTKRSSYFDVYVDGDPYPDYRPSSTPAVPDADGWIRKKPANSPLANEWRPALVVGVASE